MLETHHALFLLALYFFLTLWARGARTTENFDGGSGAARSDALSIYDDFYASIYPQLFHHEERHGFEQAQLADLVFSDWPSNDVRILDVGCGIAPYAQWAAEREYGYVGLDISPAMLRKAREQGAAGASFVEGNAMDPGAMSPKSFSHIFCMYFTAYQFRDLHRFMGNLFSWTKPGGYAVVHVVDPERFDPVLDAASPFPAFSIQKYANRRVTSSEVAFDKFKYQCRFQKDPSEDEASFDEIFKLPDGTSRRHRHVLHMPQLGSVRQTATQAGFKEVALVDMLPCHFEYQYLLVLRRA